MHDHEQRDQADGERAAGFAAARPRPSGLPLRRGLLRAGDVGRDGPALEVRLVARLALARLAGRRRCSGTGSCAGGYRPSARSRAPRTGRPRCSGPSGVGDDDEALPGAVRRRPRTAARRCCGTRARCSCTSSAPGRGTAASGRSELHRLGEARGCRAARAGPPRTLCTSRQQRGQALVERRLRGAASACRSRARRRGRRRRARSARAPGRSSRNRASVLARNGRWTGKLSDRRVERRRALGDRVLDERARDARAARANVRSRLTNSCACASAAGATMRAASASSATKRVRLVCSLERLRATGMMSRSSGRSAPIAWFMLSPRPANASPKPRRLAWAAARVSVVEHVQELVELDRRRRGRRERDRVAVLEALVRRAARQLDVLQAERRARPDQHGGVLRQRRDRALELEAEHRDAGAVVAPLDRRSSSTEPTRVAADPHLVAAHEVGGARRLRLERGTSGTNGRPWLAL